MIDLGKITLKREYDDGESVTFSVRGDIGKDELVEQFESFMKALGYYFAEGEHLGYEYDDDYTDSDPADMVDFGDTISFTPDTQEFPQSEYSVSYSTNYNDWSPNDMYTWPLKKGEK